MRKSATVQPLVAALFVVPVAPSHAFGRFSAAAHHHVAATWPAAGDERSGRRSASAGRKSASSPSWAFAVVP